MSLNILKKLHNEFEIENGTEIAGEWRVEVVCENGDVKQPLGTAWRKNLIQDRGLNYFNGSFQNDTNMPYFDNAGRYQGLGNLLQSAYFGDSALDPTATNKTFLTTTNANIYWTRRLTTNVAENTTPYVDDYAAGSRQVRKVWDFGALSAGETKTVKEIVISASYYNGISNTTDQVKGSQGTFNSTNVPII
jgi:hypothetical protein